MPHPGDLNPIKILTWMKLHPPTRFEHHATSQSWEKAISEKNPHTPTEFEYRVTGHFRGKIPHPEEPRPNHGMASRTKPHPCTKCERRATCHSRKKPFLRKSPTGAVDPGSVSTYEPIKNISRTKPPTPTEYERCASCHFREKVPYP